MRASGYEVVIRGPLKGLALVALAIAALVLAVPAAPAADAVTMAAAAPVGLALFDAVVVALQSAIYTYDGWTGPLYFGDEMHDPGRGIPRAMIGGVILVLLIYLALNLAFLRVLGIDAMAGDPFVAASTAQRLFGPTGDTVLRVLMVVSLLASVNALQLMASRVPWAMSRDRLMPPLLQRVNAGGTPLPALLASTALALIFILSGTFDTVLALLAFFFVANYALTFTALFVKRRREPHAPRPFRVPGYPLVPALALLGSVSFLLAALCNDRAHSLVALLMLALSWPIYRVQRWWRQRH